MLAIAQSAVLTGIASAAVRVEVEATRGIPAFELVGLAETAVRESRVRVKSALAGIGLTVSILVSQLAFTDDALGVGDADAAKLGVLLGSVLATGVGALLLRVRTTQA